MKARALRRLVPDQELLLRRAAGESLRVLALDYGVTHTTLSRYFARPDLVASLRDARRRVAAERRAARRLSQEERREERRLLQEVRRRARAQARETRARALRAASAGPLPRRRSAYEEWLDAHDRRLPLTRAESRTTNDDLADAVVAQGGGIAAVMQATGVRTRANVYRSIDPTILEKALRNDAAARRNALPPVAGLRRLAPDMELLQRRAGREPVRALARDYGVAHTTLSRYFARPAVARHLKMLVPGPTRPMDRPPAGHDRGRAGKPSRGVAEPTLPPRSGYSTARCTARSRASESSTH